MSPAEIWIVASTVIFAVLVWKPAARAVTGGLDKRRDAIARELEEAHRLRAEAETLLGEARARHQAAAQDAEGIVAFAREEAGRLRQQAEAEMKNSLSRREKQAADRIAQAEAAAVAEIRGRAVDLALAASGELMKRKLDGEAGGAMLDGVIAAVPAKLAASR